MDRPGIITDEMVAKQRLRIGEELTTSTEPYQEEVTRDAIRHWVRAVGDLDPKWTDEEYARKTPWGGIIACPAMLYMFDMKSAGDRRGLPGIHSFFGGADHEWYTPIRLYDRITVKAVFKDLVELKSQFARRMFKQISEVTYYNQKGEVVARSWPWGMRTERETAVDTGKYKSLELARYTSDDIRLISEQYQKEPDLIRGGRPRHWEDVQEGEEIPAMIRGPWTSTISVCFMKVHGGMFMRTHGYWYDYIRRHPGAAIPNEQGIPEGPVRGHWDSEFARRVGVPAAYDYGPERIAWLGSLMTYWCGDDGWLKRLHVEVRRFNLLGDLTTLGGKVTGKRVVDREYLVDCEIWARDQRGEYSATGNATVRLPSRSMESAPPM